MRCDGACSLASTEVTFLRSSPLQVRLFEPADLHEAGDVSAAAFGFDISDPAIGDRWRERLAHTLTTDPEGCFVAVRDGRVIGVAQAMVRERLWCLSLITVVPDAQSAGAGHALMQSALNYGTHADSGLIVASDDSRALRLYGLSGFRLLPTFQADGAIDRTALPRPDRRVREAGLIELEELAPISREVRGAAHTTELEFTLARGGVLLRL